MKQAYLYDFDKTICPGDAGSAFWLFCLVRRPWIIVFLPIQMIGGACYLAGVFKRAQRLCSIHSFVRFIDTEKMLDKFWDRRQKSIYQFFIERKRDLPTVICTASPDFIIKPICDRLGVEKLVATKVSIRTGTIKSDVCKRFEKVQRLKEELPGCEFAEVYSDSLKNDIHILRLGKRAFHTVSGRVSEIRLDI